MARDAKWYAGWIRLLPASSADEKMRNLEAADLMEELDKKVPCWISVEERLPKEWRAKDKDKTLINYLVFMPEYGVDVGNWIKNANMWVVMGLPAKVTHWMPFPTPPKEEPTK